MDILYYLSRDWILGEHGCVLEMGRRRVTHVGVWVDTPDGPKILHCRKASGGLCQDPDEVRETLTIFSYNRLRV